MANKQTFNPEKYFAFERYRKDKYYSNNRYSNEANYLKKKNITRDYAPISPLEQSLDSDPLEMLSASKRELAWLKVSMLSYQVQKRKRVHKNNLYGILQDEIVCSVEKSLLEGLKNWEGVQEIELNQMLRLSRERRDEQSSYFRDSARIEKDLIDAVLEYKSLSNKDEILRNL